MAKGSTADLQRRLEGGDVLILDGAIGTELQRRGVPMDHAAWCAIANKTHQETVLKLHQDYIRAGTDIITTNTFSSGRHSLEGAGLGDHVRDMNARAVALAKEARDSASDDRPVYIAGSLSHFGTLGESPGVRVPPLAELKENYIEQANLLAEAGVDFLLLEMIRDIERGPIILEAAVATGLPVWIGFSSRVDEDGRIMVPSEYVIDRDLTFVEVFDSVMALGGSLVAVMHSEVDETLPALAQVKERWHGPLGAYPHSGWWARPDWRFDKVISPEAYLAEAKKWVQAGVQVVGGCCGIGPQHIEALRQGLPDRIPARRAQ
jgi:methionine synthase I (cobalamin-dependent)